MTDRDPQRPDDQGEGCRKMTMSEIEEMIVLADEAQLMVSLARVEQLVASLLALHADGDDESGRRLRAIAEDAAKALGLAGHEVDTSEGR